MNFINDMKHITSLPNHLHAIRSDEKTLDWQMERIFSGAWKDRHGKTRTNAAENPNQEPENPSNESSSKTKIVEVKSRR